MIRRKRFQAKVAISALNKVPCKNSNEISDLNTLNTENYNEVAEHFDTQPVLTNSTAKLVNNVMSDTEMLGQVSIDISDNTEKNLIGKKISNVSNATDKTITVNNNSSDVNIEDLCLLSTNLSSEKDGNLLLDKTQLNYQDNQNLITNSLTIIDKNTLVNNIVNNDVYETNDLTSLTNKDQVETSSVKIYKKKKSTLMDQELNTKKFTLADLITWKPKTENTLRKKWDLKREKFLENINSTDKIETEQSDQQPSTSNTNKKNIGPRVKINENGEMVLDEESLIVLNEPQTNFWETVDDDLMPKKLNSMSFRRNYNKTLNWSKFETDLFYEVLSATGTDFSLMHEFIPGRTRAEIKRKFTKEEKVNLDRIEQTLENPTILDETLYERINRIKKKIEKELEEKIYTKLKPLRQRGRRSRKISIVRDDNFEID